jgi:O-antigen/teichoic acid export membrane protein
MRAVYGDGFAPAATPLRLLAASIPFLYLGYVLINVLVSSDRPALAALASGVAGGVTIAGNVLLIPVWGIAGSAIAAILAQASLVLVGAIATDRAVVRSAWLGLAAKPVAAGAAMLVTVALIGSAIGVAAFAVGLAVYVLALAASGALREEDVVAVRRLWRRARLGMTLRS